MPPRSCRRFRALCCLAAGGHSKVSKVTVKLCCLAAGGHSKLLLVSDCTVLLVMYFFVQRVGSKVLSASDSKVLLVMRVQQVLVVT